MRILGSRTGDTEEFDATLSTDFRTRTGNGMVSMVRRRGGASKLNVSVDTSTIERRDEESTIDVGTIKYPDGKRLSLFGGNSITDHNVDLFSGYKNHEDDGF